MYGKYTLSYNAAPYSAFTPNAHQNQTKYGFPGAGAMVIVSNSSLD
jgi:hypothetical protein